MMTTILIGLAAAAIAVVVLVLLAKSAKQKPRLPYCAKQLLTDYEREFWERLSEALPEYFILPQVAMGALLEVNKGITDRRTRMSLRGSIFQKICDYVVYDVDANKVVAVVELDDRTHDRKQDRDAKRDDLLSGAGITTVRFDSRKKPSAEVIRERVAGLSR